jgi:hypothetical protein
MGKQGGDVHEGGRHIAHQALGAGRVSGGGGHSLGDACRREGRAETEHMTSQMHTQPRSGDAHGRLCCNPPLEAGEARQLQQQGAPGSDSLNNETCPLARSKATLPN